jgi:hypothetical protein
MMRDVYFNYQIQVHFIENGSIFFTIMNLKNALVLLDSFSNKSKNSKTTKGRSVRRYVYRRCLQCVILEKGLGNELTMLILMVIPFCHCPYIYGKKQH